MLSDQDKARILEEETYRRDIKPLDAAESKGTRWQKVWGIANSAVFIWFVSSVVLGTASFLYSNWKKASDIQRENLRTANRLDAEITNRLVFVDHVLAMQNKETEKLRLSALVRAIEQPSLVTAFSVNAFPEYSNRTLGSLLWELVQVLPDREKQDIRQAYKESLQLEVVAMKNGYSTDLPSGQPISVDQVRSLRESYLGIRRFCCVSNLERWGKPFADLAGQEGWCSGGPQK